MKKRLVLIGFSAEAGLLQHDLAEAAEMQVFDLDPSKALAPTLASKADAALLFLDNHPEKILDLARQLGPSGVPPIVISSSRDPDIILRAMRAGARDFAYLSAGCTDVARAINDVTPGPPAIAQAAPAAGPRGEIISVFSCKGGSGATTIALNLAGALRGAKGEDEEASVVVVDADPEMGDVLVFLDLESKYIFDDVISNMGRLDTDLLRQSLARHPSGIYVLSQTDRAGEAPDVTADELAQVLAFLRAHFDFVVIDGLRDYRELALTALDNSDVVLCTMTQDVPALKNVSHCLSLFKRLDYPEEKIRLLINRYRNSGKLTQEAIYDLLRRPVDGTIANDYPMVIKAVNEGRLLLEAAPKGKVYTDIQGLVPMVYADAVVAKRQSLFSRWRNHK